MKGNTLALACSCAIFIGLLFGLAEATENSVVKGPKGTDGRHGRKGEFGEPGRQGLSGEPGTKVLRGDKGDNGIPGVPGGNCNQREVDEAMDRINRRIQQLNIQRDGSGPNA